MLGTLLALLAALSLQATWTVDDNGPADFASLQVAVSSVAPGDTLLVEPGTYEPFTLTKELRIIGRAPGFPACLVTGATLVSGAPSFVLAGLNFASLRIEDVPGDSLIDACSAGSAMDSLDPQGTLRIRNCGQLLVQATIVDGDDGALAPSPGPGMTVSHSSVAIVFCPMTGGDGHCGPSVASSGSPGLLIEDGSEVVVVRSVVLGGSTESGSACATSPANGIDVDASTLVLRGRQQDGVSGGIDHGDPAQKGAAIHATDSLVLWSGVDVDADGVVGENSVLINPPTPEPFAEAQSTYLPGHDVTLRIYGPAGTLGLVLASAGSGHVSPPGWDAPLWLDPSHLFPLIPVVALGQDTPVILNGKLPPDAALAGLVMHGQIVFPGVESNLQPGKKLMGNPFGIALRF